MRFVLYNHIGSANHGCEALARTVPQLFGNSDVILLSDAPEEEKFYGVNQQLKIYPARQKAYTVDFYFLMAYLQLKLAHNYFYMDLMPYHNLNTKLHKMDVLVSIGGDIFCYDDYPKHILLHRHLMKSVRRSLLIGCSIEAEKLKDPRLLKSLASFDLITAREHLTLHALKKAGLKNVRFCPDTAFCLQPEKTPLPKIFRLHQTVGINISPLILKKAGENNLILENIRRLIREILDKTDLSVALIPHVVRPDNDDRIPLLNLYTGFKDSGRVCMIRDHSAPELKWVISQCRYFIGARTHAVIAAYSSGVPAIALGYSVKSKGIARDLFGSDKHFVLHYSQLTTADCLMKNWYWLTQHEDAVRNISIAKTAAYQRQIAAAGCMIRKMFDIRDARYPTEEAVCDG